MLPLEARAGTDPRPSDGLASAGAGSEITGGGVDGVAAGGVFAVEEDEEEDDEGGCPGAASVDGGDGAGVTPCSVNSRLVAGGETVNRPHSA